MTDIHQWRRMIPPMRTRTPASAADVDDPDGITSPRKGLKPKLSMYFGQTLNPTSPTLRPATSWRPGTIDPSPPSPGADSLVDAVMCQLMAHPYDSLDRQFNGAVLQICEAFRDAGEEKEQLRMEVARRVEEREGLQRDLERSRSLWERERQDYKAEVKRLELILAKGKRGLAEVTLARRESLIRRGRETLTSDASDTISPALEPLKEMRGEKEQMQPNRRGLSIDR